MILDYEYFKRLWGTPKLARLSHMDNAEDQFALKERIDLAIVNAQNQLLGLFDSTEESISPQLLAYIKGVLPSFVEYELNPTEALHLKIELLLKSIDMMNRNKLKKLDLEAQGLQTGELYPDFGMFVT